MAPDARNSGISFPSLGGWATASFSECEVHAGDSLTPSANVMAYPTNKPTKLAGLDGLQTSNGVHFLFNKVAKAAPTPYPDKVSSANPQTFFWHIVFAQPNLRDALKRFHAQIPDFNKRIFPLYTGPDGGSVEMSGDTTPGFLTN